MWKKIDDSYANLVEPFEKRVRFLIDENIEPETIAFLKKRRANTKSVKEFGYQCRSDGDIYKLAYREKRMLLTQDDGYLDNRKFPIDQTSGILIITGCSGYQDMNAILEALLTSIVPFGETWNQSKMRIIPDTMTVTRRNITTGKTEENYFTLSSKGEWMVWVDEAKDQSVWE